eukprot:scaffold97323_cov40-Cyclotella_meneghiniana.AAC.3
MTLIVIVIGGGGAFFFFGRGDCCCRGGAAAAEYVGQFSIVRRNYCCVAAVRCVGVKAEADCDGADEYGALWREYYGRHGSDS